MFCCCSTTNVIFNYPDFLTFISCLFCFICVFLFAFSFSSLFWQFACFWQLSICQLLAAIWRCKSYEIDIWLRFEIELYLKAFVNAAVKNQKRFYTFLLKRIVIYFHGFYINVFGNYFESCVYIAIGLSDQESWKVQISLLNQILIIMLNQFFERVSRDFRT